MMLYACNKSLIRIKHIPSGHEVSCEKERSQHKNKITAIKTIKAKLYADSLGFQRPVIEENVENTICPICEKGILELQHEYLLFREDFEVLSLYYTCSYCKFEQVDATLATYNKETRNMCHKYC